MGLGQLSVLIAGDPRTPHYQLTLSGPHLNLRLGGKNREGVAFGGPIIHGDQRGNFEQGLPGNVYRYQFEKAHALFEKLERGSEKAHFFPARRFRRKSSCEATPVLFPEFQ